jgi:drug/metabolite transporter (DMT)-like permease
VPPLAIALVLVAAVLHAGWNVLVKTSADPLRAAVGLQWTAAVVLVPLAGVAWIAGGRQPLDPGGVALAAGSAGLETLYFILLAAAYRRGGLSVVYPIARGTAPLLAVCVGVGLLGERLAPAGWLGVAALVGGILLVARPWQILGAPASPQRGATGFALATGAAIAAYSAVDRVGVRLLDPLTYAAVLALATAVLLGGAAWVGRRWNPRVVADTRRGGRRRTVAAGLLSAVAYLLVLIAYSIAPLAAVAPLREAGVVLAASWGAIRLGETTAGRAAGVRIGASALILAGALLLAVNA